MISLAVGLAATMLLLPTTVDWGKPHALVLPGLTLSLGLLFGVAAAAWRNPASLLRTEHILLFGVFYWIVMDAVQEAYPLGNPTVVGLERCFFGIGLFGIFLWVGSLLVGRRTVEVNVPHAAADVSARFLLWAGLLCFVLGMLRPYLGCNMSLGCIVDSFGQARMETPWRGDRFGNWDTVLLNLGSFGMLTLPLAAALLASERRLTWRAALLAALGIIYLLIMIRNGGRRSVGAVVGASALMWVSLRPAIRFREVAVLAFTGFLLLVVMQAMVSYRNLGIVTALQEGISINKTGRSGIAVDRNLLFLTELTSVVPDTYPHSGMKGVLGALFTPIPLSVMPDKPRSPRVDLPMLLGMRVKQGFSYTYSIVGDLYMIGGYPAIAAGGIFFGWLAGRCSSLLRGPLNVRRRLLYAVGTMSLFVALRALHELLVAGMTFAVAWGIFLLWKMSARRRPPQLGLAAALANGGAQLKTADPPQG